MCVCFSSLPSAVQSHRLSGGTGLHQVWTGPLLQNTDPLCDPLAAVLGEMDHTAMLVSCDRMNLRGDSL